MSERLRLVLRPSISRFINALVVLLSLLSAPGLGPRPGQDGKEKINENELKQYLAKSWQCDLDKVYIDDLPYFDFTGDGIDEAIVVASTCNTGTAGRDIHSVFTRRPDGSLAELKIHASTENRGNLLGRVFYDLNV
jgi:hypothetical protein